MPCEENLGDACREAKRNLVNGSILESRAEIALTKGAPGAAANLLEKAAQLYIGTDCTTGRVLARETEIRRYALTNSQT